MRFDKKKHASKYLGFPNDRNFVCIVAIYCTLIFGRGRKVIYIYIYICVCVCVCVFQVAIQKLKDQDI
jgi:hypothetical protein